MKCKRCIVLSLFFLLLGLVYTSLAIAGPPPPPLPPGGGGGGAGAPLGITEALMFSLVGYGAYKIRGKIKK